MNVRGSFRHENDNIGSRGRLSYNATTDDRSCAAQKLFRWHERKIELTKSGAGGRHSTASIRHFQFNNKLQRCQQNGKNGVEGEARKYVFEGVTTCREFGKKVSNFSRSDDVRVLVFVHRTRLTLFFLTRKLGPSRRCEETKKNCVKVGCDGFRNLSASETNKHTS